MSELTLTVLQLGLLVLLWLFVLGVMGVLRGDLYGTRITQPGRRRGGTSQRRSTPPPAPAAPAPAAPPPRPGPLRLIVVEGSLQGTSLTLGSAPVTIGRAPDNTLVIEDDFASGRHARLTPSADGWVVEDLGSTNGTFLGRDRVTAPRVVPLRTPVRVGRTALELRS